MATEILVNDGGAPARILPYVADEAISAGELLSIDADGEAQLADSDHTGGQNFSGIGWALTDAAIGNIVNVITGCGVVLNVQTDGSLTAGNALMMSDTAGSMKLGTNATTDPSTQAVLLESTAVGGGTAAGLWRVQTV